MTPVQSNPANFTATRLGITFAVPAGVYKTARWYSTYTDSIPAQSTVVTTPSSASVVLDNDAVAGDHTATVLATAAQLADINAAAGGTLTVNYDRGPEGPATVHSFVLYLQSRTAKTTGRIEQQTRLVRRFAMLMRAKVHTAVYDIYGNLIGQQLAFPLAYQIIDDSASDWLFWSPGAFLDTGTSFNDLVTVRFWDERIQSQQGWLTNFDPPGGSPKWVTRADRSDFIPWQGKGTCLLEFVKAAGSPGAGATIEFGLVPFSEG